jgi:hypothetical protein
MMLADHAQVAEGKLFISGGGWALGGPGPITCGVALLFHVPWQSTNQKITFRLALQDSDGHPVTQAGPLGEQAIQVGGQFEVGRPAGVRAGSEINVPIAVNTTLQLPPANEFTWVLEIDGHTDEAWRLSFATRDLALPQPPLQLPQPPAGT